MGAYILPESRLGKGSLFTLVQQSAGAGSQLRPEDVTEHDERMAAHVAGRQWRADAGTVTVRVGGSSADLPLSGQLRLARTVTQPVTQR